MNYDDPIEIADKIFWIGYNVKEAYFRTNPYLILDGEEAVLIDPGSEMHFGFVIDKIEKVADVKKVRHIILQHQDPDLCGSAKKFEEIVPGINIYNPARSSVLTRFYGIKNIIPVKEGDALKLKSGRVLRFIMTPYCHSPGAMMTYDEKSKIIFTSDIFGAFNVGWELYADMVGDEKHFQSVKRFMEPYMASKEAMGNVIRIMENLDIKMICPQHGSIIRKDVKKWIGRLKEMNYGLALKQDVVGTELYVG